MAALIAAITGSGAFNLVRGAESGAFKFDVSPAANFDNNFVAKISKVKNTNTTTMPTNIKIAASYNNSDTDITFPYLI